MTDIVKNWKLIVFVAGGLINAGALIGGINYMNDRITALENQEKERQAQAINYAVLEERIKYIEKTGDENKQTLNDIENLLRDIAVSD